MSAVCHAVATAGFLDSSSDFHWILLYPSETSSLKQMKHVYPLLETLITSTLSEADPALRSPGQGVG